MSHNQWMLIIFLALGAYAIRLLGLLGGQALSTNLTLKPLLDDLPGCLVVALVAASLADQPPTTWIAAAIALGIAIVTNNVVVTMVVGFLSIFALGQFVVPYFG